MKDIKLFLDSGAFSAFTKGVKINIEDYIDFIKKYEARLEVYANLDVIGDPKATFKNQQIMEKAGLDPLPTYHLGSELHFLDYYVANYDYVAIGGIAAKLYNKETTIRLLDQVFADHICDTNGMPKTRTHGFGCTSLKMMLRYPWYSVDSTTWVVTARVGGVCIPIKREGKYRYDMDPLKLAVSSKSPKVDQEGMHIDNLSPRLKKEVISYIKEKGFTIKQLADDYKKRDQLNVIYFVDLEENFPKYPWAFERSVNKGFTL